jgi:hypothetical protein
MRSSASQSDSPERTQREKQLAVTPSGDDRARNAAADQPAIQKSATERLLLQAIRGEYRYAMFGLVLGLATILGGVVLGLHGAVGHTSWTAKFLGLESNLNDAAPGVVLFVVGVFFVRGTRPKIKMRDLKG